MLIINESAFSSVTFDQFEITNVMFIHEKAFGKTASTIKNFTSNSVINTNSTNYDLWKAIKSLINLQFIKIQMSTSEIPTQAFASKNLAEIEFRSDVYHEKITIRRNAFYNLDNLTKLKLNLLCYNNLIEKEAFSMNKRSSKRLDITFEATFWTKPVEFSLRSFDGIQRSITINFNGEHLKIIPEAVFGFILNDTNNNIIFKNFPSSIDCTNCSNYWMIRDGKDNQISNAICKNSIQNTLFNKQTKSNLKTKCTGSSGGSNSVCYFCNEFIFTILLINYFFTK